MEAKWAYTQNLEGFGGEVGRLLHYTEQERFKCEVRKQLFI